MNTHVLSMLERTAQNFPNKIAVIEEEKSCTYARLQHHSKAVATYLIRHHIRHEPIIVFMDKGIQALYAFFGSAYAGNFYSLLNPEFPENRLEQMRSVLQARVVLTTCEYRGLALQLFSDLQIIEIEDRLLEPVDEEMIRKCMEDTLDVDPLYVNFTSGSTGIPKGVLVSHGSVLDFIDTFTKTFSIDESERFGNQAPFDFDVSVKDIYSCLKTGATLVIIPRSYFSRPAELVDYLCDQNVTTMVWAVSALSLLCTFHALDYRTPHSVRKILFSGEVMPLKHYQILKEALPQVQFVNLYGPTEITCNCTYHILEPQRTYSQGIPIGRPFLNKGVFLLDENKQEIHKPDVVGELCVKGRGLALGYYRNPEQTALHFENNPTETGWPERIYRTGDLACYNEEKELMFKGRKDYQIKYLGHRIELEEIEKRALQVQGITQCICLFDASKHRLYGFYTGSIPKEDFVRQLKKDLPAYMIPTRLFQIDRMPLTKNGKTDRKQLMEMAKGGRR